MYVLTVLISLNIYDACTLKEKRQVLKSLKERLKNRFNASFAEVGDNDKWQASKIGVSMVSNDKRFLESSLDKMINFIDNDERVEIINLEREIFTYEESFE